MAPISRGLVPFPTWQAACTRADREADKIKATFKNGVLEVYVPKSKEAKGKKIEVKVQ